MSLKRLPEGGCGCGSPKVKKLPCPHMIKAAEKLGVPVENLLHQQDTPKQWEDQYNFESDHFYKLPSTCVRVYESSFALHESSIAFVCISGRHCTQNKHNKLLATFPCRYGCAR